MTLRVLSTTFGTTFIAFGLNAILRPQHALTFFELPYPTTPTERSIVDKLLYVYGARDIFIGLATYIAALYGTNKALAWTMLAASGVAYADGLVCYINGSGAWNHWGYAPVITVVSLFLLRAGEKRGE